MSGKDNQGRFTPGTPKPPNSGRKKGTLNKTNAELLKRCKKEGCDFVGTLIKISQGDWAGLGYDRPPSPNARAEFQLRACETLMDRSYPKLKSIEVKAEIEQRGGILVVPARCSPEEWAARAAQSKPEGS